MGLKDHDAAIKWQKEYYRKHSEEILKKQRIHRANNKLKIKRAKQEWYIRKGKSQMYKKDTNIKLEVLTHYGGGLCKCAMCGESRLACLSIDHIAENGGELRKAGIDKNGGRDLYISLKKRDYPKGYQTLCMNCQWVKRVLYNNSGSKLKKIEE